MHVQRCLVSSLDSEDVIYIPSGCVYQSVSNSQVLVSPPATHTTNAPLPTATGNTINIEAHPSSHMETAFSPIETIELPHTVSPSTVR